MHVLLPLLLSTVGCTGVSKTPDFTSDDLLTEIESRDTIFQEIDFTIYRS